MIEEWTEKYRPGSLKDIVGNEMAVRTIKRWADSWRVGVPRIKAIVLRGEPGTGKTSAALALAKDMGWDFIEMNASDHRNAESIKNVAGAGASYQTFTASGEFLSSSTGRRKLIILDEADNLFGREDKGGAKAIAETIRESGQPIILIVNDYYTLTRKTPAIKTLAESVTFRRLSAQEVIRVLGSVLADEGRTAPADVLSRIAENAGGDLRAAINDLQMMLEGRMSVETSDSGALGKRNQEKELNSTLRAMFISDTVRGARDATFDLDMTPDELLMWVEESVPREIRDPSRLANAFDAISRSDIYLARTRMLQHYGLWAYAKEMMTGGVALARAGETGPRPQEYRFPGELIVLSRAKGARQERSAVAAKLATYMHTNRRRIADSTLPYLSILVRKDEELLIELGKVLEFEESDIAHLLGLEHDSARVKRLAEQIARGKGSPEESDDWSKGRKPLKGKRGKTGF